MAVWSWPSAESSAPKVPHVVGRRPGATHLAPGDDRAAGGAAGAAPIAGIPDYGNARRARRARFLAASIAAGMMGIGDDDA